MKIHCIFGVVDGEVELLDAWDAGSVDSNPEGYEAELTKFRSSADITNATEVKLEVDYTKLMSMIYPRHTLNAKVMN